MSERIDLPRKKFIKLGIQTLVLTICLKLFKKQRIPLRKCVLKKNEMHCNVPIFNISDAFQYLEYGVHFKDLSEFFISFLQ